ncbi:MAG: prephenate dehydratase [Oscillospiraceae bacterium]|nr:prephenate dehydratase [Oscillospiraceae bacterium]
MELNNIRRNIDEIDTEIARLLCRRLDCSLKVADYKAANNIPVLNEQREKEILNRIKGLCDGYKNGYGNAVLPVFAAMMDTSRALQHSRLGLGASFCAQVKSAKRELLPPDKARVVCQGVRGAYSEQAAARLFDGAQPFFVDTFADVFAEVRDKNADYGILPVENSTAGSVNEVYDLVMKYRFSIVAAITMPIEHCLLALPGASVDKLKVVYSHPQGLAQCAEAIAARNLEPRSFINTAAAARMVSESGDYSICAIASRHAAEIYNLEILDNNIQTVEKNSTRFIAISRELIIPSEANKISLIFALPHITGSLYRTLAQFAATGLNLTKLESRPSRIGTFEYVFYLDFEGGLSDASTLNLLCAMHEDMPMFSFLGNYREFE